MMALFSFFWVVFFPVVENSSDVDYFYLDIISLDDKPIVEGVINGKKAYLLLDTGSDRTIVHLKDQKKYGFGILEKHNPNLEFTGFGNTRVRMKNAYNVKLHLVGKEIVTPYVTYDISPIVNSTFERTNIKINGIIGADTMKTYGFKIDYSTRKVRIRMN
ncbi:aspartyl protease family protein [Flexithrix dorotheae]|uniref:aspartyl protease family protein n=1 Tax=Flexithrix dorotheae TaxID=70993 RepID=UPI0003734A3C|nr:aspartyl protease family protein [Flexithrix dorotheae]